MSTRTEISEALSALVTPQDRLVVIHSSLAHLAPPSNVGKWDFLYALDTLLDAGKTVALPTFTFSFCQGELFDKRRSPSETGQLGGWALSLRGARRTSHPIYSFATCGELSDEICLAANSTTFGDDSVFSLFEKYDARIVMLGCDWEYCTQFHRYEEEAEVGYRSYKTFEGIVDVGDSRVAATAKMYVCNIEFGVCNDFSPIVQSLAGRGEIRRTSLWRGDVSATSCRALARTCRDLLGQDNWAFVADAEVAKYRAQLQCRAGEAEAFRIALLGSSNLELIGKHLGTALSRLMPEHRVEVFTAPFGQHHREILDPNSDLRRFAPQFTAFVDRPEDLAGVAKLEFAEATLLANNAERYCDSIAAWREVNGGWVVVSGLSRTDEISTGRADGKDDHGGPRLIAEPAEHLKATVAGLDQCILLDLEDVTRRCRDVRIHDPRLWFVGRFPFSDPFSEALAERLAAMVLAAQGKTARVIAVDLDNTLWGGVLGEDGIDGLALGGDFPGNVFEAFQKTLKKLSDRGIALVICSKNDENHVFEAFEKLPSMVLKKEDFVAWRIGWSAKSQGLAEMAEELGIGLENILFVDDNPVERAQMQRHLPQVKVLDMPSDPALYDETLLTSPWLECLQVTAEDAKRVRNYGIRRKVREQRANFADMKTFYASLGTVLQISPLGPDNQDRTVQLINKTNQFNTTTKRYGRQDLDRLISDSHSVLVIGAEDKFSDFENIGVLIVNWNAPHPGMAEVVSYLLSCRVLGRGIETGVILWLAETASKQGMTDLFGAVVESERNMPARNVFADAGFVAGTAAGEWQLDLRSGNISSPSWLEICGPKLLETGV